MGWHGAPWSWLVPPLRLRLPLSLLAPHYHYYHNHPVGLVLNAKENEKPAAAWLCRCLARAKEMCTGSVGPTGTPVSRPSNGRGSSRALAPSPGAPSPQTRRVTALGGCLLTCIVPVRSGSDSAAGSSESCAEWASHITYCPEACISVVCCTVVETILASLSGVSLVAVLFQHDHQVSNYRE